jgi:hypothetical protein
VGVVADRLIGAAESQDLDQFFEDDPVGDRGAVAGQRVSRVIGRPVRKKRGEPVRAVRITARNV